MTCAKQTVWARVVAPDGREFHGENHCRRPQEVCPRAGMPSGVGYHLCREVCDQPAHAEVNALLAAGPHAEGATLYLEGHLAVCPDCLRACDAAGISKIEVNHGQSER